MCRHSYFAECRRGCTGTREVASGTIGASTSYTYRSGIVHGLVWAAWETHPAQAETHFGAAADERIVRTVAVHMAVGDWWDAQIMRGTRRDNFWTVDNGIPALGAARFSASVPAVTEHGTHWFKYSDLPNESEPNIVVCEVPAVLGSAC